MPTDETAKLADECRETRMAMFLETLAAMGGQTYVCGHSSEWVMVYCEEHEGRDPDTFNQAIGHEFTTVSHDSDTDVSMVYLTDNGRRAIPRLREQAAALRAQPKDAGVSEDDNALWNAQADSRKHWLIEKGPTALAAAPRNDEAMEMRRELACAFETLSTIAAAADEGDVRDAAKEAAGRLDAYLASEGQPA